MDLASVTDFTFGAMENFGLNIYQYLQNKNMILCTNFSNFFLNRQQLLLLFSDETTENERGRLTQILAHELVQKNTT